MATSSRSVLAAPCLLVAAALAAVPACAARMPSVSGTPGAPLTLTASDGRGVSLQELWRDRAATVLVFWSAECPCVRRYQSRVDGLLDRYPADRVRVVAISSNAGEGFAHALGVARERGVRVPLYRDEGGRVAASVGARSTPTAVVIDGRGQVRFVGWIDNERMPGEPGRTPWLEEAVDGVLAGRAGFAPRTPTYGCVITRSVGGGAPAPCCTAPR